MRELLPIALLSLSLFSAGRLSADVAEPDSVLSLREVSVTALKQPARLSVQPVASTTVTADEVSRFNIVTMKQVSEIAPNLYIPEYGSRMTSSIYVRGIGARIDQPAVGLNVDNVPFLNKDNYDFDIVDIDRIEVFRGPQSVLYGRNTMGGLISIYTLSPFKYHGVRATGEYGSANSAKVSVGGYAMLTPELGMSLIGYYTRTDGFFKNEYNNADVGAESQGSVRWKTAWRPSDAVSVENVAAVSVSRQSGYPYESVESGRINYNDTCFYRRTGVTDGLTVKWEGPHFTLSGITSFQYINDNMTLDQDFLPERYFTLTQRRHEWAFTQDVIATGKTGRYEWTAGAFGFYKRSSMGAPVTFGEQGIENLITGHYNKYSPYYPIAWDDDTFLLDSYFTTPTWGAALYHQSSYSVDRLTASVGLRLDYERASLNYHSMTNAGYTIYNATVNPPEVFSHVPVEIDDRGKLHRHDLQLLPRITVSYRWGTTPSNNVYLSVAKGYKAGGYNTQMFSDVLQQRVMAMMGLAMNYDVDKIVSYRPEKSWNWEAGVHFSAHEGRLRGSAAVFYIDCRDQQLTMFPEGTTTGRIMTNAGKTRSYGLEVAAVYRPTDRWILTASYGLTNAKFREFNNGKSDFSGNRVPYAPANTLFGGVTYIQPLGLSWLDNVSITCSARGVGDIYWDEGNTVKQPFYGLLGASVRLNKGDYSLDIWGENLTGTKYSTFYFVSMGNSFLQRGRPRTWGATIRLNFKTT